jgi:2-oxo-4-hydroxy-4-carboxy--5-ureidoimidazoline (OHCU) decarboxylase
MPPGRGRHRGPHDPDLAHWNALSEGQRQKVTAQFNRFFELTPMEKKETLNTLSEAERQQMEKTLETFGKLPPAQRLQCIHAFTEFAGLSAQEKQDFLKNAQRWSQMSPQERQTWRDLVTHVPEWPPLPSALIMPPMPPDFHPALATNHG